MILLINARMDAWHFVVKLCFFFLWNGGNFFLCERRTTSVVFWETVQKTPLMNSLQLEHLGFHLVVLSTSFFDPLANKHVGSGAHKRFGFKIEAT